MRRLYRGSRLFYLESEYRRDITANGLFGFVLFANLNGVSEPVRGSRMYRVSSEFPGIFGRIFSGKKLKEVQKIILTRPLAAPHFFVPASLSSLHGPPMMGTWGHHKTVAGVNLLTDRFSEDRRTDRGFETSVRLKQDDWSLFAGYTYVDARTGVTALPHIALAPPSKVVFDLANEKDGDYRAALEAFYTGRQYLYDGTKTRDYWVTGLLVEKVIKRVSLVLNFEDLTDTRQTEWAPQA